MKAQLATAQIPLYKFYKALAAASSFEVRRVALQNPVARGVTRLHLGRLHVSARTDSFADFCVLFDSLQKRARTVASVKERFRKRRLHRFARRAPQAGGNPGSGFGMFLSNKSINSGGGAALPNPGPMRANPVTEKDVFVTNSESKSTARNDRSAEPKFKGSRPAAPRKMSVSKGVALDYDDPPLGAKLHNIRRKPKAAKKQRDRFIILTPQMKIQPQAGQENTFLVSVYLDNKAPDRNAEVEKTKIRDTSRTGIYKLDVELNVSRQFEILGGLRETIEVTRGTTKSKTVEFRIRRTRTAMPRTGGLIEARIYRGDHPCGRISKRMGEKLELPGPDTPKSFTSEELPPQDAIVEVRRYDGPSGFELRVIYPGVSNEWKPLLAAGKTLDGELTKTFGAVEEQPPGDPMIDFLRGVGRDLYLAMPDNFKALVDVLLKKTDSTMIVYSDEGMIPWELLVRSVGTKTDELPIGAHVIVGRWITDKAIGVRMPPKLNRAFVSIASPKLSHADREARALKGFLPGSVIKDFEDGHVMCAAWASATEPIIHYIGHGEVEEKLGHTLVVAETRLTGSHISGSLKLENRFASTKPLVFLNACMAGQAPVKYLGAHGLPQALIGKGASAVVSPNWSVGDSKAADLSKRFYAAFKKNKRISMARVLRDARRLSYRGAGNQTWAAYSFFGHPAAHGN